MYSVLGIQVKPIRLVILCDWWLNLCLFAVLTMFFGDYFAVVCCCPYIGRLGDTSRARNWDCTKDGFEWKHSRKGQDWEQRKVRIIPDNVCESVNMPFNATSVLGESIPTWILCCSQYNAQSATRKDWHGRFPARVSPLHCALLYNMNSCHWVICVWI